jgi:hypothetical protein
MGGGQCKHHLGLVLGAASSTPMLGVHATKLMIAHKGQLKDACYALVAYYLLSTWDGTVQYSTYPRYLA